MHDFWNELAVGFIVGALLMGVLMLGRLLSGKNDDDEDDPS